MKNYYFITAMLGLLFMGCSVDNDEVNFNNDQIITANSVIEVDGCETLSANLYGKMNSLLGESIITNDVDNLYLNFLAADGFLIHEIRWQVISSESDLPINGNGINANKLENRNQFNSGIAYHGETISLREFGENPTALIVVARLIYKDASNHRFITWIGDEELGRNESKFLIYNVCPFISDPECEVNAGGDVMESYSLREIDDLVDDYDELDALLRSLLDEGADRSGTFDPTPQELGLEFYFEGKVQDFETTYTVTNELNGIECSDSANFLITITEN